MLQGYWIPIRKRIKLDFKLTAYTKIDSKWVKELNIRAKTIKGLEENIGDHLRDIRFFNNFLNMIPKSRGKKGENSLIRLYQN